MTLHDEVASTRPPRRRARDAARALVRLEFDRDDLILVGLVVGAVLAVTLAAALAGWAVRVFLAVSGLG